MAFLRGNPADYESTVKHTGMVHEPEQWYWHLYYKGERVNGGIAFSQVDARHCANYAMYDHDELLFREKNVWDTETCTWIPRAVLGLDE